MYCPTERGTHFQLAIAFTFELFAPVVMLAAAHRSRCLRIEYAASDVRRLPLLN